MRTLRIGSWRSGDWSAQRTLRVRWAGGVGPHSGPYGFWGIGLPSGFKEGAGVRAGRRGSESGRRPCLVCARRCGRAEPCGRDRPAPSSPPRLGPPTVVGGQFRRRQRSSSDPCHPLGTARHLAREGPERCGTNTTPETRCCRCGCSGRGGTEGPVDLRSPTSDRTGRAGWGRPLLKTLRHGWQAGRLACAPSARCPDCCSLFPSRDPPRSTRPADQRATPTGSYTGSAIIRWLGLLAK